MEVSEKAIGLLDSGVGGLTAAREIFKVMPEEHIIYYGDTLHLPYGPKDLEILRKYVEKIIKYLIEEKEVKAVILACNTATSAALDYVKGKFDIPIFGMIKSAAVKAVEVSTSQKVAVIGTEGTINSLSYQNQIYKINSEAKLFAKACPKFVELVEAGKFDGYEVQKTALHYLSFLKETEVDTLILGCTHFPYLIPVLDRILEKKIILINPAFEMALEVKNELTKRDLIKKTNNFNKHQFIVSDKNRISKRFLEHGRIFLNLKELDFKERNIFS